MKVYSYPVEISSFGKVVITTRVLAVNPPNAVRMALVAAINIHKVNIYVPENATLGQIYKAQYPVKVGKGKFHCNA